MAPSGGHSDGVKDQLKDCVDHVVATVDAFEALGWRVLRRELEGSEASIDLWFSPGLWRDKRFRSLEGKRVRRDVGRRNFQRKLRRSSAPADWRRSPRCRELPWVRGCQG